MTTPDPLAQALAVLLFASPVRFRFVDGADIDAVAAVLAPELARGIEDMLAEAGDDYWMQHSGAPVAIEILTRALQRSKGEPTNG